MSPFGLELAPKLQRSTPPFRDSYQTAVYYAVLQAVGFSPSKQRHGLSVDSRHSEPILVPTPRIFEIGRFGPVDITVVTDPARASVHPDRSDIGDPSTRSPSEKIGSFMRSAALWGVVCIVGSVLLVPALSARAARYQHVETSRLILLLVLVLGAAGLFVVIAFLQGAEGEPFEVLSGVSVWPTEILRFYVVLLSSYLSFRVFQQLDVNQKSIEKRFRFSRVRECESLWETVKLLWAKEHPASAPTAEDVWIQYARRESVRSRLPRVLATTALFMVLGYALMAIFGHARVPARQYLTFQLDRAILFMLIVSVSFLHCLVLDATSSCDCWVTRLGSANDALEPDELVRRMRLIEARTAVVGRFVLYPLVCAVLAVASRSTLFDEWRTPPGLLAIFGLLGVYTVICSWILVRSANAARSEALAVLRRQRWETFTGNVASPTRCATAPSRPSRSTRSSARSSSRRGTWGS